MSSTLHVRFPRAMYRALGVAALVLSACAERAEDAQCEAFADRMVEFLAEADERGERDAATRVAAEMRGTILESCKKKGTKHEVECVLAAESISAVRRCAG